MFYRLATDDDFKAMLDNLNYEYDVPLDILALIKRDGIPVIAVKRYRELNGKPLIQCKQILEKYLELHRAYRDYKEGKPVYTKY